MTLSTVILLWISIFPSVSDEGLIPLLLNSIIDRKMYDLVIVCVCIVAYKKEQR